MAPSAAIKELHGLQFCWLCGTNEGWIQIAHLQAGAGEARRVDDARAVVLLCHRCHSLHTSNSKKHREMTIDGITYPTIGSEVTLWLKRNMDGSHYDTGFLEDIWIGNLPTPKEPPQFWKSQIYKNQGLML